MMILRATDLKPGRGLAITIFGNHHAGECIATGSTETGDYCAFVKWSDDSIGRITDGFLAECSSVSIQFACPYQNAACETPGAPIGFGHHADCLA